MTKRNKFNLGSFKNFTCRMGNLIPCGLTEVLPGDTIQHATSLFLRTLPLLAPVMHPVRVQVHHWFVPHRLVWDSWEDFITGGPDGEDDSAFPYITTPSTPGVVESSLADYLGLPPGLISSQVSALPFRGYGLIFNEWYRDQDLVNPVVVATGDGSDTTTNTALLTAAWEKDYFTSARPWEAKGPTITVPIGDTAPVTIGGIGIGDSDNAPGTASGTVKYSDGTQQTTGAPYWNQADALRIKSQDIAGTIYPNITGIADLSGASAITINALREAMALQRYQEARARYGSRYSEYLAYLGVKCSDARLQKPEYLGGGKQTIQFSEVLQTAEGTNPVGEMRGHGISAMRSNRYRKFFEEHGYVFSFFLARPKTIYSDGLARTWNRRFKEDFWQKELQHIGQQEILNKEVRAVHATPNGIFGYQDRYDEYRRAESTIAGAFRDTLDFWQLARQFETDPALNAAFITCTPSDRIFPVEEEDHLLISAKHHMVARRMIAREGTSFIS